MLTLTGGGAMKGLPMGAVQGVRDGAVVTRTVAVAGETDAKYTRSALTLTELVGPPYGGGVTRLTTTNSMSEARTGGMTRIVLDAGRLSAPEMTTIPA